jgi:hypothetical protein
MSKSNSKRRRLGFEGLEQRQLLTGDVSASIDANLNLILIGDFVDNHVIVTKGSIANQIVVRGGRVTANDVGTDTLINGLETASTFNNVRGGIIFNLGEGNDRLVITNLAVQGNITGNLGDGNDQVGLESSSNGAVKFRLNDGSTPVFGKFSTSGLVNINGNNSSDTLALYDATISGSLTFNGGNSNDRFISTGTSTQTNLVGTNVQLTPGPGNDTADVFRMAVGGNFRIDDGSAVAGSTVKLVNLRANADIIMNMSIKRDFVQVLGENDSTARFQARNVIINTGDDDDRVFIEDGVMVNLTLTTGNGSEIALDGTAGVRLVGLGVNTDLDVDTGDADDIIFMNFVSAKNLQFYTQNGNDSLTANNITVTQSAVYESFDGVDFLGLHDSKYSKLTIKLDDGDDTLQVRSLNVTQSAFFNGNLGTNIYQDQGGNVFAILTKLNFK